MPDSVPTTPIAGPPTISPTASDCPTNEFTVARTLQRVLDRAIQALGALGMTDDTPLAWWWGHERAGRIYDGADEVHVTNVAKRILKRYAARVKGGR